MTNFYLPYVKFDNIIIAEARAWDKKIRAKFGSTIDERNYTKFNKKDRWFDGRLCELIFQKYLNEQKIPFIDLTNDVGQPDKGDCDIWGKVWDAKKCASSGFFYNQEQALKYGYKDFYCAVLIFDAPYYGEAQLKGWLTGEEVKRLPIRTDCEAPAHFCRFDKLHRDFTEVLSADYLFNN